MSATVEQLLQAARELSPDDRRRFIEELIADDDTEGDLLLSEETWQEIRRRSAEYDAGLSKPIPWAVVKQQVRDEDAARG